MAIIMKILVPYPDETAQKIKDIVGHEAEVVVSERTVADMLKVGGDAEVIASGRVPAEFIRKARSLRMIQSFGAGIDKIDHDAVLERGDVIVCNNHANAAEVAEYAIMLLLATAKHIVFSDRQLRQGDWAMAWGGPLPNHELRNKTCLIVGFGHIGREIAKRLRAFDMYMVAATRSGRTDHQELVDEVMSSKDIIPILKDVDYVILSLPLTTESRHLVDSKFLSEMKSSSVLVNISRGHIIEESALYRALSERTIAGAGLDVWWDYPSKWGSSGKLPSENYPFHDLDNVVLSPHRAAYSENIVQEQFQFAGENILRFVRGETPLNIVDLTLGY